MKKVLQKQIELTTKFAWCLVGTPYHLGGNVPQHGGMDCSAFVLELLRSLGLWGLDDATAQDIHNRFRMERNMFVRGVNSDLQNLIISEADILFFGKSASEITHIAYGLGGSSFLEAGGNDQTGMIRLRSSDWRSDLVAVLKLSVGEPT